VHAKKYIIADDCILSRRALILIKRFYGELRDHIAMIDKAFFRSGDTPTLFAAFLYFDISFMVWVMLGPLGVQIASDLELDNAQKGLMVAVPVLAGAGFRVVLGVVVDHLKPRRAGRLLLDRLRARSRRQRQWNARSYPRRGRRRRQPRQAVHQGHLRA
jgi:hypothetical protein